MKNQYSTLVLTAMLLAAIPALIETVAADSPNLTITTNDQSGNSLPGYYVEIRQSGSIVNTEFSPASFTLAAGNYEVSVGDYGGYYFSKWSDGTTTRTHTVTIGSTGSVTLTAIYSTSAQQTTTTSTTSSSIKVSSQYADGSALNGMYVTMQQNGAPVDKGFTTVTFTTTSGQQYTIIPSDYTNAYFSKWSDGNIQRNRIVTATNTETDLTAIYSTSAQQTTTSSGGGGSTTTTAAGNNLVVNTQDQSGNPLTGYWTVASQGGATVKTGFSPIAWTLAPGNYDITVGDYGGYYFSKWSDGTTTRTHTVTIGSTGSVTLTAIYSTSAQQTTTTTTSTTSNGGSTTSAASVCSNKPSPGAANTVTVVSCDLNGNPLTGFYANIRLNGNIVATGFTPVTFTMQPGNQYVVVLYWCCDYYFRHYDDGTLTRYHYITPDGKAYVVAGMYEKVPASQAANLNVVAQDTNGKVIGGTTGSANDGTLIAKPGMWMWLTPQGASAPYTGAYSGSSSTPFVVFNGQTYTITMSSYGQYQFDHWQDNDSTNPTRTFTMNGDNVNNYAVYRMVATASSTSTSSASAAPFPWYNVDG